MKLGKLSKRLRKELLANPKQAAVLAVVCLVAIWFWSPLLLKWYRGKTAAPPTATGTSEPAAPLAAVAKEARQYSWLQVQAWRSADPLTRPAPLPAEARDPFRSLQVVARSNKQDDDSGAEREQTVAEQQVAPEKLGLVLQAIVYGGSRRLAQISGRTVQENDEIRLGVKKETSTAAEIVGRVTTIHPNEVVLDIGGNTVRLRLQSKLLSHGDVVERTKLAGPGSP